MKKIILLLGAVIFLLSKMPTWAATSCRGRNDCPSGYECVYLDESGVPRLDSTNSANNAFCARIYQGVTSVPTRGPTPNETCNTYFWFDDNNLNCEKRVFCGNYMYLGLHIFKTLEECKASLPKPKYAKEGEACGGGRPDSKQCEPGLRCDYSKNFIQDESEVVSGMMVGAMGICVKDVPTVKPTKIDDCRLKVCGDANCDGIVNSIDLINWKQESSGSADSGNADFNNDGDVNKADYDMLQLGLQKKCGVPTLPIKYAKEGEFCGAGPSGVVQCEEGLKCDESRNRTNQDSSEDISGERVGAGGVCVKITPIAKPTKIDDCRLKVCGDANCDGKIDTRDRLVWIRERFSSSRSADFNQDNRIDMKDYSIITSGIQNKCQPIVTPKLTLVPTRKPVVTPLPTTYCRGGYYGGTYGGPACGTSGFDQYYLSFTCADNTPGVVGDTTLKTCYNKNDLVNMAEKFCSTHSVCSIPTPTVISRLTPTPSSLAPQCGKNPIKPESGRAPLKVTLHGSGLSSGGPGIDGYRWDFDGNGTWDTNSISVEPVIHIYTTPGVFRPKFQVDGVNGLWSSVCDYGFDVIVESANNLTPIPTAVKTCDTDADCSRTETCYQPPMPTCPAGENCTMALPLKYCKPVVVSEVTGVEEKIACKESKGDANRDGKINLADYAIWRYEYAKGLVSKADFNCDNRVDTTDYKIWRETFLETKRLTISDSN